MLKTMLVAGSLALAGLAVAPQSASAASFGNQTDVGTSASPGTELAQYYYYRRPRYVRRNYYRPRYYRRYGY